MDDIPDEELWAVRQEQRAAFVEYVRAKSAADRLGRGEPLFYAEAAARAFDPEVLTIGFARRLATYKRLYLLVRDAERSLRLLSGDRPVQLVLAGKAHPRDDDGKRMVQELFSHKWASEAGAPRRLPGRLRPQQRRPPGARAATCGSTSRARRWRRAARAG